MLMSINGSSVSVAFPIIITELNTTLVIAGWVMSGFQLVNTIVMPVAGKLSEIIGRKNSFILHVLLFTAGSILASISGNIYMLIGARIIQATGGGGFLPCATGIVSDLFPDKRQRYIGFFTSIFPIGMIIGPNAGGWLVDTLGWRSIFWVNIPLCLLVLLLGWWLLPSRKDAIKHSLDVIGAGLLFAGVASFMFAITSISNIITSHKWTVTLFLIGLSILLIIFFLRYESKSAEPLISLKILRERPFLAANIFNFFYGFGALGIFSLIPLYVMTVYQKSALESGFIITGRSFGMIFASTLTSMYIMKWGYRRPMLIGTLVIAIGIFLLTLKLPSGNENFFLNITSLLFMILILCGLGAGTSAPAANNACIELMPEHVATITGLRGMFRNLGSAIGVSVTTVVVNSFQNKVTAFNVVFYSLVALMIILMIPAIFNMPSSPTDCRFTGENTDKRHTL